MTNPVADALVPALANTWALFQKTQTYHWNVVGPTFSELHALFNTQYDDLHNAADTIAEHIRALNVAAGEVAKPIDGDFLSKSTLSPNNATGWQAMVRGLVEGHAACVTSLEAVMAPATEQNDQSTINLISDRITAHRKATWMLAAHLE